MPQTNLGSYEKCIDLVESKFGLQRPTDLIDQGEFVRNFHHRPLGPSIAIVLALTLRFATVTGVSRPVADTHGHHPVVQPLGRAGQG